MSGLLRYGCALALLLAAANGRADDNSTVITSSVPTDATGSALDLTVIAPTCESIDCDCYQPKWNVSIGTILLHRSQPDAMQIVRPTAGPGTISNGSDYNFNSVAAAPDITIGRVLNNGTSIQVRFFGASDFNTGANYGAVGNVQIGSFSNFGATNLTSSYNSRLYSTEVNWLRPVGDRLTILAGFRALEVRDLLAYNITFPAFNAVYSWKEVNQLYGAQLGSILNLWRDNSRLAILCSTKAGVFSNSANNSFNLLPSTGGSFPAAASTTQTSFVGDINFTASYAITDHISIRGGYQLLWVQDLALASNQAALATANHTQAGITTHGDLFYNGATAGLVVTW